MTKNARNPEHMYQVDTSRNPAMYDVTVKERNESAILNHKPIIIGQPVNLSDRTVPAPLDLSIRPTVESKPYTLTPADIATRKASGAVGVSRFLDNALAVHHAVANGEQSQVYAIMAEPCLKYASRQMLKKWSLLSRDDTDALSESVQDIACMLLEMKPLRLTVKGQKAELVDLSTLDPMTLYRALVGRAYRLMIHNYGIGHNRTPALTRATKAKPAQFFLNVPLDAFRSASQSAESSYIADVVQAERMAKVESFIADSKYGKLAETFTPAERSAFRAYLEGDTTSTGPLVRGKAKLAKTVKDNELEPSHVHGLLLAIVA